MKKDWEVKKLGEVCNLQNGVAFKSRDYIEKSNVMNFRMSQIRPGGEVDLENNPRYLPQEYAEKYKEYLLNEGDIVIAMTDMATETKILGVPTIIKKDSRELLLNQRVGRLYDIKKDKINGSFLRYMLVSPQTYDYYKKLGRGGLQINISKKDILNANVPVPPLSEQQRIVALMEQAFEAIDKAKENAEKNLQNAKEVFESYLESVFSNPAEDWEEKKLGDVTNKIGSGATPKGGNASYKEIGISLIRSLNVYDNGFRTKKLAFIDEEQAKKLNNVTIFKDDVLLNITGASIARCCIVPEEILPARVNQHVSIIRPNSTFLTSSFLHYSLISKHNKDKLLKVARVGGSTREALTKEGLSTLSLIFPKTLIEQQNIVEKLDLLQEETKKLESIYKQKLTNLDELKKSILKKAFDGEL